MHIEKIPAKTIVSGFMEYGWFGSSYNMNIYKGCSHGCVYCDSRSECYRIENFDMVKVKEDALSIIENDLKSKRKTGVVITGAMSDPYNPIEKSLQLTREALKLIDKYGFGIAINTKSPLVLRDIDILKSIKKHSPVSVSFTVTCSEDELSKRIEQSVAPSSERFNALKELTKSGVKCGILLMPVLPFICDNEENINGIFDKAVKCGVKWIYSGGSFGVTLRQNQRIHFFNKIDEQFPGMSKKYIYEYGQSYVCKSPNNLMLINMFKERCRQERVLYSMRKISEYLKQGYYDTQLSLF